jgi:acyl-CoA reductase-like NAD-dependent aldehyde dehydrogenase
MRAQGRCAHAGSRRGGNGAFESFDGAVELALREQCDPQQTQAVDLAGRGGLDRAQLPLRASGRPVRSAARAALYAARIFACDRSSTACTANNARQKIEYARTSRKISAGGALGGPGLPQARHSKLHRRRPQIEAGMDYKLTYSTMFNPPAELHERFEAALTRVRGQLVRVHANFIGGADQPAKVTQELRSPINRNEVLGRFPEATVDEAGLAMTAAQAAFPAWSRTAVAERNRILRRAAELIEERVYDIAAAVALEVGKNRMEALGEVQETADFFTVYCADYERQNFDHALPDDPLPDYRSHNRSVMKPYGAWVVITPFNFPFALAGGPVAAALVTGNTVVLKGATDTPWAGRLLADCLRDAGLPPGVFNYVCGRGEGAGAALVNHPDTAGITFTGSHEVGMQIYRRMGAGAWPRPCIAEMGGKNPVIVSARADLERAAVGIIRSAFGLSGQKCSAASRIYAQESVAGRTDRAPGCGIARLSVGDPTRRENWMGPVVNERAHRTTHATARSSGQAAPGS